MPVEPTVLEDSELAPLRILIVEDDPVMRLGLKQFLDELPQFQVVGQATDGYEAIAAVRDLSPDLVIMDIGLPQLDGIAATREIKSEFAQVRVMMLTSHNTGIEMVGALSSGADAYCIKGTSIQRLLGAIAAVQDGAIYLDPQIARTVVAQLQPPCQSNDIAHLTARELEILKLVVDGCSNPEIAEQLLLSLSTVKAHVRNIMNKLAVDDRVQAAVVALRSGLV